MAGRPRKILTGKRFNRLLVGGFLGMDKLGNSVWICHCDCGATKKVPGTYLLTGHTSSCGCFKIECAGKGNLSHGDTRGRKPAREYRAWWDMRRRTTGVKRSDYRYYGGRGIKVCDRWFNSYEAFLKDMGRCPEGYTIERIDNNGNYEPSNCRWASRKEQASNRRNTKTITFEGRTQAISAWSDDTGISYDTLHQRLSNGIDPSKIFSPVISSRKLKVSQP